jgi:hypothetical protein
MVRQRTRAFRRMKVYPAASSTPLQELFAPVPLLDDPTPEDFSTGKGRRSAEDSRRQTARESREAVRRCSSDAECVTEKTVAGQIAVSGGAAEKEKGGGGRRGRAVKKNGRRRRGRGFNVSDVNGAVQLCHLDPTCTFGQALETW